MYDIVFFDLDGTLTDPKTGITSCVQYALESFGICEPDKDKLIPFIGPPLKASFKDFYGMTDSDADKAVEKYRERFSSVGLYENEIFDGVEEMLEALKESGKTLALVTSKPYVYAKEILRHFDILKYFGEVFAPDLGDLHSEKTHIVARALESYGVENKKRMIMVGDRRMDITGAKDNGIASVGVRFGYAEENELEIAGADFFADSVPELKKILMEI
ncbi:MAG: HAD hydrolase-like protein [Clostridia bacterium]|nr:HAD hydrolase-like protein [Clostridia bacterium]